MKTSTGLRPLVAIAATLLLLLHSAHPFLTSYRAGLGIDGFGICPAELRNCSCRSYTGAETEIDCPEADSTVHLRIEPHQYAEMRCQRNRRYDFDQIPQLSIGDTNRLTIDDCPFPRHQSILQLVSFLGTGQVKVLWLKNNANHEHSASLVKHHFAGLEHLDRLAISNAKLSDIGPDLFEHLPNLTWLDMRDNIFRLPVTIFDALPKLRILELSFNSLEELDPRLLRHLPNLRLLTLWHNKLRTVSRQAFAGVPELERLDLSANQLEAIPGDLFADLPRLTELAMGFNNFRTLPDGLFRANRELRKLKLASQRVELETLPGDLLQNLPSLEHINLERVGLIRLPGTLLYGSPNVTQLNLAYNQLRTLPEDLLRDQRALYLLQLQHNELTALPGGLLRNTVELHTLQLSHNQISELSAGLLQTLTKLEELYLDHNQLHTIELHAFRHTNALHTLHLQENQLSFETLNTLPGTVPDDGEPTDIPAPDEFSLLVQDGTPFQHLHMLRELDLSSNWLTTVPRDLLLNTHELQRLNLTRNNITSLTYANLQFLAPTITVDLRHNSIFEIDLADMERLVLLDPVGFDEQPGRARILLNDNPLNCNCIVYAFAQYIQNKLATAVYDRLELVANRLTCHGPEHLAGTLIKDVRTRELLCELDTPSTQIRHCPPPCRCYIRPEDIGVIIDCSGQGLTEVPDLPRPTTFGYRFIELHIENNNISALPEPSVPATTSGWNEVRELYASNNSIAMLASGQLPNALRLLDLSHNKLTELEPAMVEALTASGSTLTTMRLAHNDWTCQCEATQFLRFAHANQRRIEDFGRLRCSDGRPLEQTTLGDLCIDRTHTIVLICVTVSVVACLVAVLSLVYYTYKLELKVWLFKHGICLWLVAEDELDKDKLYDAFVSYSHKDEAFITEHLVPTLEREPMNFKLCWHVRDWTPGEMISSQISSSVEQSRRTIIVLSRSFLESLWGQLEFRTAHLQSMAERRNRLIIVIYGDIGNIDELEPELRAYLHTNTYVRWGDPWFWDKVRFAMPHPPKVGRGTGTGTGGAVKSGVSTAGGLFMKQLQGTAPVVDDKLELIKPQATPATPPILTTPPAEPIGAPAPGPFIISGNGSVGAGTQQHFHQQLSNSYRVSGHINGAFVINSNAKQSDV